MDESELVPIVDTLKRGLLAAVKSDVYLESLRLGRFDETYLLRHFKGIARSSSKVKATLKRNVWSNYTSFEMTVKLTGRDIFFIKQLEKTERLELLHFTARKLPYFFYTAVIQTVVSTSLRD